MALSFSRTMRKSGPEDMKSVKVVEERLLAVNGVKALGLAFGDGFLFDGDDAEAGLVNLGQDGAGRVYCGPRPA